MISVCIATYNGAKYIKQQVESILSQLSDFDEIIVSDDNSIDDTINILKSFNDDRIKIFSNHSANRIIRHKYSNSHYKVTNNFENALCHAQGDFIFLADQDDVWEPNKVSSIMPFLENGCVVQSNYSIIDSKSKTIESKHFNVSPINGFLSNLIHQPFHGCCMAFPKSLLSLALPFPSNLIMHDNWFGLLSQLKGYRIQFIETPLIKYRRYSENVSPQKSENPLWFKISYRIKLLLQIHKRIKLHF